MRSDLSIFLWVSSLHLSAQTKPVFLQDLAKDRSHRWIGTTDSGAAHEERPEILVYSAFHRQFTESGCNALAEKPRKQHPRLISFFGEAGVGKSTIIKNLIRNLTASEDFEVPVAGSKVQGEESTSGGIHVYVDPGTFATGKPIVYAGLMHHSYSEKSYWQH